MSLLSRVPLIRQSVSRSGIACVRNVHIENTVGNNMPFSYSNRRTFAVKLTLFLLGGFSIPFLATRYQLKKGSAST